MAISWRRVRLTGQLTDLDQGLALQPRNLGDDLIGRPAAIAAWKQLATSPFLGSTLIETSPPIHGHRLLAFGAGFFVTRAFADAEFANPRPGLNARVLAALHHGIPVVATRAEIARANATDGLDILILQPSCFRSEILNPEQTTEVEMLLVTQFAEWIAGYRVRRIFCETADESSLSHIRRSVVYQTIAEFPAQSRALHAMTWESVSVVSASVGNIIFRYYPPVLRLRESDQQLLQAALDGATDPELAATLGITFSAVKARWRSAFARIEETMPALIAAPDDHEGRGQQKRHRVLAYLRTHLQELRPYDWPTRT